MLENDELGFKRILKRGRYSTRAIDRKKRKKKKKKKKGGGGKKRGQKQPFPSWRGAAIRCAGCLCGGGVGLCARFLFGPARELTVFFQAGTPPVTCHPICYGELPDDTCW